jgi:hypothetical protein
MWIREHPRNPDLNVILLDTEGLDAPHVSQYCESQLLHCAVDPEGFADCRRCIADNWALAAITLLISTVFIYQTRGNIDKASIERLDLILKLARQVKTPDRPAPAKLSTLSQPLTSSGAKHRKGH